MRALTRWDYLAAGLHPDGPETFEDVPKWIEERYRRREGENATETPTGGTHVRNEEAPEA